MMYLALAVIGFGAFLLLCKVLWGSQRPSKNTRIIMIASLTLVSVLGIFVLLRRIPWFVAAVTMVAPFARVLMNIVRLAISSFFVNQLLGIVRGTKGAFSTASAVPPENTDSATQTSELAMKLDHSTGTMTGSVLVGKFKGNNLDSLSDDDLLEVYRTLQEVESKRLLEAYVARHRPHLNETSDAASDPPDSDEMSLKRAADILGVAVDATKDEIVGAHRRLMDKLHPDKGGSSYLAAELNAAKKVMLDAAH